MRPPVALMYACRHPSTYASNDQVTETNHTGGNLNSDNDTHLSAPQQKLLPMHCYNCVQARHSAQALTMSGVETDDTEDIDTQIRGWVHKYDTEAAMLCQANESAAIGVRDFGLEESAYLAARRVVKIVKGLDELREEDVIREYQDRIREYEDRIRVCEDVEDAEDAEDVEEMRGLNGRVIIPSREGEGPMRVIRERRSTSVEVQVKQDGSEETDEDVSRSGVNGKMDEEERVEEMPKGALKRSFFGSLKGLRDGAIARLGFRKNEKKSVESDVETGEGKPLKTKKK
ncbi:hypothetical protein Vi05172_g2700 [Venturia inaequalis]|nr:hypothetical protein Vi05172_g2700 [Venturia inaequalis]